MTKHRGLLSSLVLTLRVYMLLHHNGLCRKKGSFEALEAIFRGQNGSLRSFWIPYPEGLALELMFYPFIQTLLNLTNAFIEFGG